MSTGYFAPPPAQPVNAIGLVGFIISLVGIFFAPAAPIGAIISLFGLKHVSKSFAVAGFIIGLVMSMIWGAVIALFGTLLAAPFACCGLMMAQMQPEIETSAAQSRARERIEQHERANGELPDEKTGNELIAGIQDGWDKELRYEPHDDGENYTLRSAGPDGLFDTGDDKTFDSKFDSFEFDDFDTAPPDSAPVDSAPPDSGPLDGGPLDGAPDGGIPDSGGFPPPGDGREPPEGDFPDPSPAECPADAFP